MYKYNASYVYACTYLYIYMYMHICNIRCIYIASENPSVIVQVWLKIGSNVYRVVCVSLSHIYVTNGI